MLQLLLVTVTGLSLTEWMDPIRGPGRSRTGSLSAGLQQKESKKKCLDVVNWFMVYECLVYECLVDVSRKLNEKKLLTCSCSVSPGSGKCCTCWGENSTAKVIEM